LRNVIIREGKRGQSIVASNAKKESRHLGENVKTSNVTIAIDSKNYILLSF